ncbi:MAG TPA: flagellar biosynthesis protein FlhB [Paenalcaligenes sp.]|nr:flagellar biosynthesis protein FlhB [Paenalcaligenes sp.]
MAEESDLEKTEPASPRRLEKAREEGQIARSRELNTFLILAVGVATLWFSADFLYRQLMLLFQHSMSFEADMSSDTTVMVTRVVSLGQRVLMGLGPLLLMVFITAVIAPLLLGGLVFSSQSLTPKFERLNPIKGVKRLFAWQTLVELLKTLAKAGLIGVIAVMVLWHYRDAMLSLSYVNVQAALAQGMRLMVLCCALIVAGLLIIVLIDVPWQLFSYFKKLRMSRQEVKDEHKESEGDPHVKSRVRAQQRAIAQRRMMSEVSSADVVVTNPSHFAVALRYAEQAAGAPRVVAKGRGLVALQIIERAERFQVPILEAPPLARILHHHVALEQEIPPVLYASVAQVLAWVYQLKNWQRGQAPWPNEPDLTQVPHELDPQNSPK